MCYETQKGAVSFDSPFFMHSPVQRKYAAKAAHGARGE